MYTCSLSYKLTICAQTIAIDRYVLGWRTTPLFFAPCDARPTYKVMLLELFLTSFQRADAMSNWLALHYWMNTNMLSVPKTLKVTTNNKARLLVWSVLLPCATFHTRSWHFKFGSRLLEGMRWPLRQIDGQAFFERTLGKSWTWLRETVDAKVCT